MRYDELTIPEQLLVLGLEDKKGTLSWRASAWFDYALAGGMLAELFEEGCIRSDEKGGLHVVDGKPPSEGTLGHVLERIKAAPGVHARSWVATLPTTLDLIHEQAEELVRKKVLERQSGRVLFLFHRTTYPLRDATPEKQLIEVVRKSLAEDFDVPTKVASLIAIANAAAVLPPESAPVNEEHRAARLARFAAVSPVATATVQAIDDAIKAVSIASNAALLPP